MSLLRRVLEKVASKLPTFVIADADGSPYLSRHFLFRRSWLPGCFPFSSLPSVYLHYFHRGDHDRALHNHPWKWSISFILTGGYYEERRVGETVRWETYRPGSYNIIRHNDYHRVDLIEPEKGAWTLFFSGFGGRVPEDDWGFWDRDSQEYWPWREFLVRRNSRARRSRMNHEE